jgi:HSP20 family molecular chaperone IbpA
MQPELIESMREQVGMIYRALTGSDLPEYEATNSSPAAPREEDITRSFAELEALVRTAPALAEKIPPFSFTPPLDVISGKDELVFEMVLPGIERADVTVQCTAGTLVVSGIRRAARASSGRSYSHTEIPYGPFYRDVRIPFPVRGEPAVELDDGLLRVRVQSVAREAQSEHLEEAK